AVIAYQLRSGEELLVQDTVPLSEQYTLRQIQPAAEAVGGETSGAAQAEPNAPRKNNHWIVLAGVGFKLLKSVKVFKAALAAASLSVYSILFSVEFALALIAILVFHECGHLRAMKKFGIPTKGMY